MIIICSRTRFRSLSPFSSLSEARYTLVKKQKELLAVGDGFAEIMPEKISILTDMAALEAEIDEAKAEEALKAAENRLKGENLSDEQIIAAEAAAAAAMAQLKVKRRNRS